MTLSHLTDFPDRISPMLVKELRQGLRAKTFIAVFLTLQIFLGIMLLSASAASTTDRAGSVVSGMIFGFFSLAVLIVQPLRGVAALATEIKGNTIDMMVLTRLSAWRIVFGKWVALVSQSALILSTIIPYLILRYFFGGMNLVGEMVFLGLLFLTSMGLTAITVGLSGSSSVIIRSILPLFGTPVLFMAIMGLLFGNGSREIVEICSLDNLESTTNLALYVVSIAYLGWSALSLGTSLIAPAAENHSTPRRLVALAAMGMMIPVMLRSTLDIELLATLIGLIAAPAILLALTEPTLLVPTVCVPFVRRGLPGKLAGIFLYPGLASGVFFTMLLAAIALFVFQIHPTASYDAEFDVIVLSMLGVLLFPAVLQCFFFKGEGQRVANYMLLLLGSGILTGILAILASAMSNHGFLWVFIWNPMVFMVMTDFGKFSDADLFIAVSAVDLILVTILFIKAITLFKGSREVIQQAEENLTAPDPR
jgi:ABC-type transport system involved in multi-copper enzyme maturation permease subunit